MKLPQLWSAAGFLVGLQLTALTARVARELQLQEKRQTVWLPWADFLNLFAILILVLGVFALPLAGFKSLRVPGVLLGLSAILLVGYGFALVGHYELFVPRAPRPQVYRTKQETLAIGVTLAVAAVFTVVALVST